MSAAALESDPAVPTLADVLRDLGDVPPHRILWRPTPGTATEADALFYVDREPKRLVELVDGNLVEKAMGYREAMLASWIATCLNNFVVPRRLGFVAGADGLMRLRPGLLCVPDVSFVARASLPSPAAHRAPIADFAPDLAVEVVSDSNTRAEIARKRREYFAAGTRRVWVVDPRTSTVTVSTDAGTHVEFPLGTTLDGGDLLPGFALPVAELFGYLDLMDEPE